MTLRFAPAALLAVVALNPGRAKADITLFDQDGWTFRINGLIAAHYQLITGDPDPQVGKNLSGGQILDENNAANNSDPANRKLTMSRVRSGFLGSQIGFGVSRQVSPNVRVDSMLSLWVNGIDSNRGQDLVSPKIADFREAWAAIVSPYGTLKFGRMFGVFGEGSAEVMMMAWKYGVGNPCVVKFSTVACGSSGAGPLYAGFDAAIRYISPRLAGFQFILSMADPVVSFKDQISPYPRVDAEINGDGTFGPLHIRAIVQTMFDRIGFNDLTTDPMNPFVSYQNVYGIMGTGIASIAGLTVGGGGWAGQGVGERVPLEANDPANPISFDGAGLPRQFRGFYGNLQYAFLGNSVTVGGGELFVNPTATDKIVGQQYLVLTDQYEGHAVFSHSFDVITVNLEYMRWHSRWLQDPMEIDAVNMPGVFRPRPTQTLNFMGFGVNYFW